MYASFGRYVDLLELNVSATARVISQQRHDDDDEVVTSGGNRNIRRNPPTYIASN